MTMIGPGEGDGCQERCASPCPLGVGSPPRWGPSAALRVPLCPVVAHLDGAVWKYDLGSEAVMKYRGVLTVAVVAVLAAGVTTAVAVTTDDDNRFGHRDNMMSSRSYDQGDGQRDRQRGSMMPGPMYATGVSSEYAYLTEMIAHHEEAVTAAQQLQRSPRAEMREFGEAIIDSQSAQIDLMQQWLTDWYPTRSGQADYQPMMRDLTDLSGDRLDRVFLQDMVGHHMGAVMMSQRLLMGGVADHEQVAVLAQTIRDDQHAEIFQMQQWLQEWFGQGWQHGMRGGSHGGMQPGVHSGGTGSGMMH